MNARILVVDDEPQILRALRINLRVRGYEVDTAATGGQALEAAGHHPPDLVILDLKGRLTAGPLLLTNTASVIPGIEHVAQPVGHEPAGEDHLVILG